VKSAILLAALLGGVRAVVREPHRSRDHTERMLRGRGVEIVSDGATVELPAGQSVRPADVRVPGDPSSAAYFAALGLLADDGELRLDRVCLNPTRTGFFDALRRMGADIRIEQPTEEGGEPVGTIVVRPSELRGIEIDAAEVPAMIDELPLFACVASRARGTSIVRGAGELRVKESDRIATIVKNLSALGSTASEREDGFRIAGNRTRMAGTIETHGDHRIAMSFGVLGALPGNDIAIDDRECVAVSFPGFWNALEEARA
jgi:3-phosphoshikimate 1-carboxyvinyltransferase